MSDRPQLGEWREITNLAQKAHFDGLTRWLYVSIAPIRAMYIGYRTVADGKTIMEGDPYIDGVRVFTPQAYHEVWLFVTGSRRNPVYVFSDKPVALSGDDR